MQVEERKNEKAEGPANLYKSTALVYFSQTGPVSGSSKTSIPAGSIAAMRVRRGLSWCCQRGSALWNREAIGQSPVYYVGDIPEPPRSVEHWFSGTGTVQAVAPAMSWITALNFYGGRQLLMGIWAIFCPPGQQPMKAPGPPGNAGDQVLPRSQPRGEVGRRGRSLPHQCKYLMSWLAAGPSGHLWAGVMQSDVWWVSAVPLTLPNCPSADKESFQTHQQHWDEATLPRINHAHQKFTEAKTCPTVSMSSFIGVYFFPLLLLPRCHCLIVWHLPLHGVTWPRFSYELIISLYEGALLKSEVSAEFFPVEVNPHPKVRMCKQAPLTLCSHFVESKL